MLIDFAFAQNKTLTLAFVPQGQDDLLFEPAIKESSEIHEWLPRKQKNFLDPGAVHRFTGKAFVDMRDGRQAIHLEGDLETLLVLSMDK